MNRQAKRFTVKSFFITFVGLLKNFPTQKSIEHGRNRSRILVFPNPSVRHFTFSLHTRLDRLKKWDFRCRKKNTVIFIWFLRFSFFFVIIYCVSISLPLFFLPSTLYKSVHKTAAFFDKRYKDFLHILIWCPQYNLNLPSSVIPIA